MKKNIYITLYTNSYKKKKLWPEDPRQGETAVAWPTNQGFYNR